MVTQLEITNIEKEIKRLFALPQINDVVVSEFNKQMSRWKFLTNHQEAKKKWNPYKTCGKHLLR